MGSRMGARKPREPLSRERALASAIALVDAEGMAALTMRRDRKSVV